MPDTAAVVGHGRWSHGSGGAALAAVATLGGADWHISRKRVASRALIDAGLRIEHLHEFPFSTYQFLPFTRQMPDTTVRLTKHDSCVPRLYSIKATKPA